MAGFDENSEEKLISEAEDLMRQGRYQDAVGRYEELCTMSPSDVMVRLGYASALECAGDIKRAEQVVDDTANSHSHNRNVYRFQHLFFERREDLQQAIRSQEKLRDNIGLDDGPPDQLADLYFNQGRYHEALKELERIQVEESIDDSSMAASILGRIGACYRQAGAPQQAIDFLEQALEQEPDNHWLLTELAETQRADHNPGAARLAYEQALELVPDDHFARSRLAQLEVEAGNNENAIELYEAILEEQPKANWAMIELSQVLSLSNPERSRQLCEEALDVDPTFPYAYAQLGQLARMEQDLESARSHFNEALSAMPQANWILHELADIANQLDRTDEAQTHLDRARSNDPFDPITYGVQADFLRQQHQLSDAMAHLRKAVELDPDYAWAWREMAEVAALLGQHDEAAQAAETYERHEEQQAYCDGLRAFLLRQRNLNEASLPYLERAVAEQPDYFWAWRELIEHHLQAGQLKQAEQKARQAIKHIPEHAALWGLLAETLRQRQDFNTADDAVLRALELSSQIPQLWALRAEILLQQESSDALHCARQACSIDPAPEYQVLEAQCLLLQDDYDDALQILISIIEQDRHDAYLYDMATDIAMRQGDTSAAILWAERGLNHHPEHRRLLLRRALLAIERGEEQARDLLQQAAGAGQLAWQDFILPFARLDDIDNARRYAYLALEQQPDDAARARVWLTLAEAELMNKQPQAARRALEECLACDDQCLAAHLLCGMLAEQEQELDQAEQHLRSVFEVCISADDEPDIDVCLLLRQLAHVEEQRHQYDSAAHYLQLLREYSDDDLEARIDAAALQLRHGDQEQAEAELLAVIDNDDCSAGERMRATHNLAWYYLQRHSAARAHRWLVDQQDELDVSCLQLAAQLGLACGQYSNARNCILDIPAEERDPAQLRLLARALIGLGESADAAELMAALQQREPEQEETAVLLGEALAYEGRLDEALVLLRQPQLPLVASDERLFLVACILLEAEGMDHCLSWLGHKPANMVAHAPLKRLLQAACGRAWQDRDCPIAGERDLLSLPPFPRAMRRLASALHRQQQDLLACQLLHLAHGVARDRDEAEEATAIASDAARLMKQLGQHQLARQFAWHSRQPGLILRCLLPW